MAECVFCKIGAGEIPGDFLYRDEHVFAIRDLYPKAPVHVLVIPRQHVEELADEPLIGHMVAVAGQLARQEGVTEGGYRLLINQGRNAGQEIAHLHLHVLGGRRLGAMA